jgi:hypothetical protein
MTTPDPRTGHRPALLPAATFLVALLLTAASGAVAVWWSAIDQRFIEAADDAGWDQSLLLPHQTGLTVAVDGALLLSIALSVMSFVGLIRSRQPGSPTG